MGKPYCLCLLALWCLAREAFTQVPGVPCLFKAGDSGYACFRIPAVIATERGTLLAFAEARRGDCGDAGDIDLVMRRSEDGGRTWSPMAVVWDDEGNTCGNPAPVADKRSGRVLLLTTWNLGADREPQIIDRKSTDTRRVFLLSSSDDGRNWTRPGEITSQVKRPDWTWYATGPGNGIQIREGRHAGRLVIPCDHIESDTRKYFSHTIHSDDGGETWNLGGTTPDDRVNECAVAETGRDRLLLNMRNYDGNRFRRTSSSQDGGMTWSLPLSDTALPEPVCQASMVRLWKAGRKPLLAFSNPANQKKRMNMTVRWSFDGGRRWEVADNVHPGPSAYSSLVELPRRRVGLLFEGGRESPYEGISWKMLDAPRRPGSPSAQGRMTDRP
jgi:sialidase-1